MRGDAVGPDLLSPIYGTHMDRSPVSQEVALLRVPLTMSKRKVTIGGEKVDLNAEQYDTLAQLSGKPAHTYLEGYIQTLEYRQMKDADRVEAIREVMKDFRKSGLDALKGMYSELGGNLAPGDAVPPLPECFKAERKPARTPQTQRPGSRNHPVPPTPLMPPGFVRL